jgi:short-subunit dehydrogenase
VANKCKRETTNALTQVSIVPYDAASVDSLTPIVDSALAFAAAPGIDVLILNAGVYQTQLAMDASKEERDYITRVNYQAPVDLAHALMDRGRWKERGHGQIVVVSSIMSHGPQSLCSTYAASKAALKQYFHTLSTENHSWLRVDVACPGPTDTSFWQNSGGGTTQGTKGGKMTPERVARLILMGVTGPYWLFYETWITKIAGHIFLTLSHCIPTVFNVNIHVLGQIRMAAFEHEKIDIIDVKTVLEKATLMLLGKYP